MIMKLGDAKSKQNILELNVLSLVELIKNTPKLFGTQISDLINKEVCLNKKDDSKNSSFFMLILSFHSLFYSGFKLIN